VPDILDFTDDDSIVVTFGDHGEEFDHGHYDHERLYDECVRVPLYYRNIGIEKTDSPLREIDIAPKILDSIDVSIPAEWDGQKPRPIADHPAMMVTPEPGAELLHAAIRTDSKKLIKSFDRESGKLSRTEYYDLAADPNEQKNLADEESYDRLENYLDDFVVEHESALDMDATTGLNSAVVESRLEDLGYK
jgi:arylsulfatase A-like enzyme